MSNILWPIRNERRSDLEFQVALCGLTGHKAHLLQVVVSSSLAPKYRFYFGQPETLDRADIAIVETMSSASTLLLGEVLKRNPKAVAVYVSEHGLPGDSRFSIARRSLLLQIQQLLERVVDEAIIGEKLVTASPGTPLGRESRLMPLRNRTLVTSAANTGVLSQHSQSLLALVVDDSSAVREQARAALQQTGFTCQEAANGEQALSVLSQHSFDLALFDVVMPGVDGYDLCRRVKRDPHTRNLPVLMLTSRSSPFDRARGALVGCDSYLVKPIVLNSFFAAIDKVVSKAFKNDRQAMAARGFRAAAVSDVGAGAPVLATI